MIRKRRAESQPKPLPTSTSCFLCGEENPLGLKIRFMKTRDRVYTEYLVDERRVGFDGVAHGGILAALLDETMGWAAALAFDRMCVTAEATVRYLKRVPTGTTIVVSARPTSCSRKLCATEGEVRDGNGTLYARATGKFMPLSVEETRWIDSRLVYREGEQSVFNLPDATVEVDQDGDGSSHIQTIENSTVSR